MACLRHVHYPYDPVDDSGRKPLRELPSFSTTDVAQVVRQILILHVHIHRRDLVGDLEVMLAGLAAVHNERLSHRAVLTDRQVLDHLDVTPRGNRASRRRDARGRQMEVGRAVRALAPHVTHGITISRLNLLLAPLVEVSEEDLAFQMNVNVYGPYRVTKAFAPLIIESQGRIVNISSISGVLAGGLTGYGFYFMSKHAIEAYCDSLAREMERFGVKVSAIEPGNYVCNESTLRALAGRQLDFPLPERPMTQNISPRRTSRLTSATPTTAL